MEAHFTAGQMQQLEELLAARLAQEQQQLRRLAETQHAAGADLEQQLREHCFRELEANPVLQLLEWAVPQ